MPCDCLFAWYGTKVATRDFSGGYEGKDLNGIESGMKAISAPSDLLLKQPM